MKNKIILAAFLLVFLVFCQKRKIEPKDPNYTNFKVLKLTLWKMPFQDGDNLEWDILDGPDVFFKIELPGTPVLYNGLDLVSNDVSSGELPINWDLAPAYQITNIEVEQFVTIYDYDLLSSDDQIGYVGFTLSQHKKDYPKTITKTRNGITITLIGEWY